MDHQRKLAFDFARDTTKQLITLATAILSLSVTFSKNVFGTPVILQKGILVGSWVAFLLSIAFGVWALLALTGSLDPQKSKEGKEEDSTPADLPSIYASNITFPTLLQIGAFLIGLSLAVWFGIESLRA